VQRNAFYSHVEHPLMARAISNTQKKTLFTKEENHELIFEKLMAIILGSKSLFINIVSFLS
jgi:hypothetical protein